MPLKRTESIIFELSFSDEQPESAAPTDIQTSSSIPSNQSTAFTHNPASRWISIPPPAMHAIRIFPKSRYGAIRQSSPLGPKPHKYYRRVFPHSQPKPNLYRKVLVARAMEAAGILPAL